MVYLAVAMGLQALRVMAQCLAWSCPDVEERVHLFLGHGEYVAADSENARVEG